MTSNQLNLSRRSLLTGGVWVAALGVPIPFLNNLPDGVTPIAFAQSGSSGSRLDKPGLTILSERPINFETPAYLLDDETTPGHKMFVRNNGHLPDLTSFSDESWMLDVDGEVENPLSLSIADLKSEFEHVTLALQMECGGNGRRYFSPGASGNQWSFGAVACPSWTGIRLADVLERAGLKSSAVYTAHYGADPHLTYDGTKTAISRGVPIEKALDPYTIIAWAIDGENMPELNGHPLRLVVPGWPGSCSQKWLTRIWVRDRVHDGAKMGGQSYRVPRYPVPPGIAVPDEDMEIIESMPVKSIITFPETGVRRPARSPLEVRGHAWAGDKGVTSLDVSIDFGATWQSARLSEPANKYAWQRWGAEISFPKAGYFEVWARATDETGMTQPPVPPGWNPRGYLNNMQHRIAVLAT